MKVLGFTNNATTSYPDCMVEMSVYELAYITSTKYDYSPPIPKVGQEFNVGDINRRAIALKHLPHSVEDVLSRIAAIGDLLRPFSKLVDKMEDAAQNVIPPKSGDKDGVQIQQPSMS